MMDNKGKICIPDQNPHRNKVHKILAHSYFTYFIFFIAGIVLDLFYPLKVFHDSIMVPVGIVIMFLATMLIFWAQKSTRNFTIENLSKHNFTKGPYKHLSNPTHFGLFFAMLGFGIAINALYLVAFTLVYFFIDHFFFLRDQDRILEAKYGEHFKEYKKTVKF